MMTTKLRTFILTAHVITSIGWFGAVASFLALAITGLVSRDVQMVRAACLAMAVTTWVVILPLCLGSVLTGFVSALGTEWGLFRYYWVLVKLLITLFATIVLLVHTQPISLLAAAAANTTVFNSDLYRLQLQMTAAAGAALIVLIGLTALSLYKPRGLTPYGWRKQQERRTMAARTPQQ